MSIAFERNWPSARLWSRPAFFCGAFVWFLLAVGQAADGYPLTTESVNISERGEVVRYVLRAEGREFRFIPPAKWTVRYDPVRKTATLLPPDLAAGLSFTITSDPGAAQAGLNPEQLRSIILARYPEAQITAEFKCYSGGKTGVAFDFERVVEKETKAAFRVAFVPYDGGVIEFELKTTGSKLPAYHHIFGNLLNSFRIEPLRAAE